MLKYSKRRMGRFRTALLTIVLLPAMLIGAAATGQTREAAVRGIAAPLDIAIDRWGIPHISAGSVNDAFFGQGYAAATLRLWQLDILRRRQLGRLAEVFGPAFVPFDQAARLVLYRGPLDEEWKRLDPRIEGIARAFVAGVNARIKEVREDRSLLPPEFASFDMLPDFWRAEDLLRARLVLSPNIRGEVRRAELACKNVLEADAFLQPLEPAWKLEVPQGLDPCDVKRADLRLYDLLTQPLPYASVPMRLRKGDAAPTIELSADMDAHEGSNAWVIAPSHTTTGRPILANDPHLFFSLPSPRMITHLSAPGFNLVGAGPAWLPGVQFGHTDRIAFGRTDLQIDQQDLYVLELSEDGKTWRGPHGPEPIERTVETIDVRDQEPAKVELAFTSLGPVISETRERGRALVMRSASLEPGAVIGLEYVPKVLARNWDEFRKAIRYAVWGTNYMYADVDGNIGWQAAGRVPIRVGYDGLMPVPASGDYAWKGILPLDHMPGEFNPERGWIASSNQMPLPPDWPVAERRISFEWIPPDRYRRVVERLPQLMPHAPADSWALQQDVHSARATRLVALLAKQPRDPANEALALMQGWNGNIDAGSQAAALYEFWLLELQKEIRPLIVPEAASALLPFVYGLTMIDLLERPDARFGSEPEKARDALLLRALAAAATNLRSRARPGQTFPTWGELHEVVLHHALEARLPADLAKQAEVSGRGTSGDGTTVFARWWAPPEPKATGGASFRAVLDVGNWDEARATMGPGQAGTPGDPHFRDLYPAWLDNESFPLAFSAEQVARVAESRVRLLPTAP
ncbi:MAG: penicillin amidase [Rhodospirillaceae bacterium]|jgi:penicillin amidase|nr:penicillin amidase [Rhodospirillaceae bacterium]